MIATPKCPQAHAWKANIEFRNLTFTYPTTISGNGSSNTNGHGAEARPVLRNINLKIPAGLYGGHCRADGKRQDHTGGAGCAPVGSAGGRDPDRWPPDPRMAAGNVAARHWLRAAGHLSVQRNRWREHCLWIASSTASREILEAAQIANLAWRCRGLREEIRDHGGRARHHACPADKNSGRPSRAR